MLLYTSKARPQTNVLWYASLSFMRLIIYTYIFLPEGDGPRSFSELVILKALMNELKTKKYPEDPDKVMLPCEEFGMIGGRGVGGYVVLDLELESISNPHQDFRNHACKITHVC
jgi:hypothetical protein